MAVAPALDTKPWTQLGHVSLHGITDLAQIDAFVLDSLRPYEAWAAVPDLLLVITCDPGGGPPAGLAQLPGPWHALDALRPMPLCASADLHRAKIRHEPIAWPLPDTWTATNRLEDAVRRDLRCSDCIDWIHA